MAKATPRTRTRPAPSAPATSEAVQPVAQEKTELNEVMGQITKTYGATVMRRASAKPQWKHIPTNIFTLDMALLGGIPEGLATEIFGWESSGKTTTAMRAVASCQQKYSDRDVVYMDFEHTFDPTWSSKHGVNNERLWLVQPSTGEEGLDIADAVMRTEQNSLIVVDSLPAIVPFKEVDASLSDDHVALQARLIGKFLRKMQQAFSQEAKRGHYPTVIFINQYRMKIGGMSRDPKTLPGGNARRYVMSVMIEMKNWEKTGTDDRGNNVVDVNDHSFTIKKNKTGNSLRSGEFSMIRNPDHPLGQGFIDDAAAVVTYMRRFGLCTGASSSWTLQGIDHRFRKLEEMAQYMYEDLDYFEDMKRRLITLQREKMGLIPEGWY